MTITSDRPATDVSSPTDVSAPAAEGRPHPGASRRWCVALSLLLIAAAAAARFTPLPRFGLAGDLGIQLHLSRLVAEGAVPIADFEHGWNAATWYFTAWLYRLAGGDPTVWAFLWRDVFGTFLAGAAVLVAGWRLRLQGPWLLGLAVTSVALTQVPHAKYALPALWLLAMVPTAATWGPSGDGRALTLRAGVAAATVLAQVDTAAVLSCGVALYDLFGAETLPRRSRLLRAVAAPAGALAALVVEMGVYATLGVGPLALLSHLVLDQTPTYEGFNFGYPLFAPTDLRMALYPASLVLPFAPAIWWRLRQGTRLVAFLHLAQAVVAIRRPDDDHVAAAATLMAALLVLGLRDLLEAPPPTLRAVRSPARRAAQLLFGATVFAGVVAVGFGIDSFVAALALIAACVGLTRLARRDDPGWVTAGATVGAVALIAAGLGGRAVVQARDSRAEQMAEQVAEAVQAPLERCVGQDRRVWVVPMPLSLYKLLDVDNPTPFTVFHYGFAREQDRVRRMLADRRIPTILQYNDWPASLGELPADIEARYRLCAEVTVPPDDDTVRIWTLREPARRPGV